MSAETALLIGFFSGAMFGFGIGGIYFKIGRGGRI